jgi:hypothetical protein
MVSSARVKTAGLANHMTPDDVNDVDLSYVEEIVATWKQDPGSTLRVEPDDSEWTRSEAQTAGEAYRDALRRRGFHVSVEVAGIRDRTGFAFWLVPPSRAERAAQKRRRKLIEERETEEALRDLTHELAVVKKERDNYRATRDTALSRLSILEDAIARALEALQPDDVAARHLRRALGAESPHEDN